MGKMRNCGMRNAEGKMRNGMCGATVIGRDVTSRDFIYSAFHHTLCQLRGGKLHTEHAENRLLHNACNF